VMVRMLSSLLGGPSSASNLGDRLGDADPAPEVNVPSPRRAASLTMRSPP
jgi:hypothetical protein